MAQTDGDSLRQTLEWLTRHAGFPAVRLEPKVTTLLCLATLAAREEEQERQRHGLQRRDPAQTAALRTHGLRRAQVHFKCDNSAKV